MDEKEWIERFNRDLDRLLDGEHVPEAGDAPEEYRQALQLARQLKEADFSRGSRQRAELRARLMQRAEEQLGGRPRRMPWKESLAGASRALAWGALALVLVVLLSWTARNLVPAEIADPVDLPFIFEERETEKEAVLFRSDRYYLELALPPGWAAAEGPAALARPYLGQVAANSWGEAGFWAQPAADESGGRYNPAAVLQQIPEDGAYIVLHNRTGGRIANPQEIVIQHTAQDLAGLWPDGDCREAASGSSRGVTILQFQKWWQRLQLEVYCGEQASDRTVAQVSQVLESWRFDRVPAGDMAWAALAARELLPASVAPQGFPFFSSDEQAVDTPALSSRQANVLRTTRAEVVDGDVVVVTFTYDWNSAPGGASAEECPVDSCHWWRFEARPDGQVGLVEEGGPAVPRLAAAQTTPSAGAPASPAPSPTPAGVLAGWSDSNKIRARLAGSSRLWDTLWAEALITTSLGGEPRVLREQVWIDQPDRSLWLSGPINGDPTQARIMVEGRALVYDRNSEARSPREFKDSRLAPTPLHKMLFPVWSLALRDGTFALSGFREASSWEALFGRDTVIVDYTNVEGMRSDRFWVDAETGMIYRWEHFPARLSSSGENETFLEILITDIEFNVAFEAGLLDLRTQPPDEFANNYLLKQAYP